MAVPTTKMELNDYLTQKSCPRRIESRWYSDSVQGLFLQESTIIYIVHNNYISGNALVHSHL